MKISFFPAGTEDTASSRIRVFSLYRSLLSQSIEVHIGNHPDSEVLFIQKKLTEEILRIVVSAKKRGALIIYDIDDGGDALTYWAPLGLFKKMMKLADVITVDTSGRVEYFRQIFPFARVELLPDCIDYFPIKPVQPLGHSIPVNRILWFGSVSNIQLFEKYVPVLSALPNVQLVVLTNSDCIPALKVQYPVIEFLPWAIETFVHDLQTCQMSVLMHDGNEADLLKSNNRMITSITWGVPAIVSNTPEYQRTANGAGISNCVFSDVEELIGVIQYYLIEHHRILYLESAQSFIWEHYCADHISQMFMSIIQSYGSDRFYPQSLFCLLNRLFIGK